MAVGKPTYSKEEAARRGDEIYDRRFAPKLNRNAMARSSLSIWIAAHGK